MKNYANPVFWSDIELMMTPMVLRSKGENYIILGKKWFLHDELNTFEILTPNGESLSQKDDLDYFGSFSSGSSSNIYEG